MWPRPIDMYLNSTAGELPLHLSTVGPVLFNFQKPLVIMWPRMVKGAHGTEQSPNGKTMCEFVSEFLLTHPIMMQVLDPCIDDTLNKWTNEPSIKGIDQPAEEINF